MQNDLYRINHQEKRPNKKRRRIIKAALVLLLILILAGGALYIKSQIKPETKITQSKAVVQKVTYESKTKHYLEGDFSVDLPLVWQPVPRPAGQYKSFTWHNRPKNGNLKIIEIFEDTIPAKFAVNRMQVIESGGEQVTVNGPVSENCSKYTKGTTAEPNQVGVPAKWQGVDFLCDQSNVERDVTGTSSAEGINTVTLTNPGTGTKHKFFFTYTEHSLNPDYTDFYSMLNSFRMQ